MDNFTKHLAHVRRRFPSRLPIGSIGYVRQKRSVVDHDFQTFNFSFILKGTGFYDIDGHRHQVEAPTVLTQWPGPIMNYGPDTTWEELFLIYHAEHSEYLHDLGFLNDERRIWRIGEAGGLQTHLRELLGLCQHDAEKQIDRIDRCAERLVMESLLVASRHAAKGPRAAVRAIRQAVEVSILDDHDFDALARERGLSPTHFRRLWGKMVGVPPARYVTQLRLRRACQMLVETEQSISKIAEHCGFLDSLYFARRFKSFTGLTASTYRERYRVHISLADS